MDLTATEKLRRIAKLGPKSDCRLLAPLAFACSAQIESWPLEDYFTDPAKLVNGLRGVTQTLEVDVALTACAAGIEVEALGAELNWASYPPRVVTDSASGKALPEAFDELLRQAPRLAASLEATRRLGATLRGSPALAVGLTGVVTLARELELARFAVEGTDGIEHAGRVSLAAAKAFLLAGTKLVVLVEDHLPALEDPGFEAWIGALRALNNVANFHQALLCLTAPGGEWPPLPGWLRICSPYNGAVAGGLALGTALDPDPRGWNPSAIAGALITTASDLPAAIDLGAVRQACLAIREYP